MFCFLSLLAAAAGSAPAKPSVSYTVEVDPTTDEKSLVVSLGEQRFKGPSDAYVEVVSERDFDRDGVMDALISTWVGGTCCPEEYSFVSVKDGALIVAGIEHPYGTSTAANAEYSVDEEAGVPLVFEKTDAETFVYRFDGHSAVRVRTVPGLTALAEIHGVGEIYYSGPEKTRSLSFDLDGDGHLDEVTCEIWTRWGSLVCALPLPHGKSQTLQNGCQRLGVLEASSHGYKQIVCDNDTIIRFDGTSWTMAK